MALVFLGNKPVSSPSEFVTPPAQVNYIAPVVQLQDFDGNPVSLTDYRGQVVLVNNWATWCPPCKEEMPTLQAYFNAHQQDGFTIMAVESGNSPQEVARFVEEWSAWRLWKSM